MTLRSFVLALVLLVPTIARAEPISIGGMWSSATLTSGGLATERSGSRRSGPETRGTG